MKRVLLGLTLVVAVALCASAAVVSFEGDRAAKLAAALKGLKFSVSDAVLAAEKETSGKAVGAEIEVEKGKAIVEVLVLKEEDVQGVKTSKLLEVEVDGESNKIIEVERRGR
ncbi:MAG: hypothetical protein HY812_10250 [Planctomycetes bacterium]|nr:hypothetical protein [Planctomycetota bacterium]